MPWLCCSAKNDVADDSNLKPASSDEDLLRSASEEPYHEGEKTPFVPLRGRVVDRRLEQRGTLLRPPPEKNADHAECDPLNENELAFADAITSKLSPEGRQLIEDEAASHALIRTVRGYWTYDDRENEACKSLEAFVELRRKYDLNELARGDQKTMREALRLLRQWRSMRFAGYDVYGHPIVVERVGQSLKLTDRKDVDKDEIIRGRAVCMELFQALKYASSKHHDPADANNVKVLKHIYVVDMKNVKTWHVTSRCRDRFRSIMQTMELSYPEVAWRTYVVNAPKYLTIIWVVIKSWLDPVTTSRVAILGTNPKNNRERLLADNIPLDAIPACCGGESRDVPLSLLLGSHDSSTVSHLSELITPLNGASPITPLNGTSPKEVVVASEVAEKAPVAEEPTTSPRLKAIALAVVAAGAVGGAAVLGA